MNVFGICYSLSFKHSSVDTLCLIRNHVNLNKLAWVNTMFITRNNVDL